LVVRQLGIRLVIQYSYAGKEKTWSSSHGGLG